MIHRLSYFGEVPKGYEEAPWTVLPDGSVVFTLPERPPVVLRRDGRLVKIQPKLAQGGY